MTQSADATTIPTMIELEILTNSKSSAGTAIIFAFLTVSQCCPLRVVVISLVSVFSLSIPFIPFVHFLYSYKE